MGGWGGGELIAVGFNPGVFTSASVFLVVSACFCQAILAEFFSASESELT